MGHSLDYVQEIMKDQEFVKHILQFEEPTDVQKAFAEKNVDLTLKQVEAIGKAISAQSNGDELSPSELESVSGGIALETITVIIGGITIVVKIITELKKNNWKW